MNDTIRKVLALFGPGESWRLAGLAGAMVVRGLLQTVGIASIMPFIAVVTAPELVTENRYLAWAFDALGFQSTQGFVMALGLLFIIVMVVSNAFNAFTTWMSLRILWRNNHQIAHRLLQRYLDAPYSFHLDRNSAKLAKSLLGQVGKVISGVFVPLVELLARGVAAACILGLLIAVDPLASLVAATSLSAAYAFVFLLVRGKQTRLGVDQLSTKTSMHRIANETFGGIKEVKALGRESYFLQRFHGPSLRYSEAQARHVLLGELPRLALETVAFSGVIGVVLYLLQTRQTLDQVFPVLAVYGIAANRLMPSLQMMFGALNQIRFNSAVLDDLYADMVGEDPAGPRGRAVPAAGRRPADPGAEPIRPAREIRLEDVSFRYPGGEEPALRSVNLVIPANRTVALVGPTGAGKTTLADLLLGLFVPTEGRILVDDIALDDSTLPRWRGSVGYVPQTIFLCDDSIIRNVALGLPDELIDRSAVERAARAAHLEHFVGGLRTGYDSRVGERGVRISGGQRQRIGIARALYHNPPVLVMDEATSALDNVTEDVVMQAIRDLARSRTIVLIAHRLSTVQECDLIYLIERGTVAAQGTFEELVESSPTFRAMARV